MNGAGKAQLRKLGTGISRLDEVLGGGIPEFSFNVICGDPGSGKTTLMQQIVFANASTEVPALYLTVLGEPPMKMMRYQQQFSFFDVEKVDRSVHLVNLAEDALAKDLGRVLESIVRRVESMEPAIVVVDSFRTLARGASGAGGRMDMSEFVERLAMQLTSWQSTSFLIGEYGRDDVPDNPVFTIADGILLLSQNITRNSMVRKLEVLKLRGTAPQPGLHTIRIGEDGVEIFPRMVKPSVGAPTEPRIISTGITGLDDMLGGGTLSGSSLLLAGPSGSGKSTLALQFIAEGAEDEQPGVIVLFEESVPRYIAHAAKLGVDLEAMQRSGAVELIYIRPPDLSVDEMLYAIEHACEKVGAKRVVIDSISGFEAALAPTFQQDFRESLYRLVEALTSTDITVLMCIEITESYQELRFTPHQISFLSHDVILQRYIELQGQLRRVITVVKARGRKHSNDMREYAMTDEGVVIGDVLHGYRGILSAIPVPTAARGGGRPRPKRAAHSKRPKRRPR